MAAWNDHSLEVAYQTAHGTPNTTDSAFQALLCDIPEVKFEHEITELDLMSGQVGAAPERLIGRRSGTLRFTIPLEGLVSGYDGSENPGEAPGGDEVIPPWFVMVANALGSNNSAVASNANWIRGLGTSVSQYTANGVTAAGTSVAAIVCDDATASNRVDVGQLVVTALSPTSTVPQIGFVATKSEQTLTLFEDSKNAVADNDGHIYGTTTAYVSSEITSTAPLTFRWIGQTATLCYQLEDAYCDNIKISWEAGAVPTCEMSYRFYNFQNKFEDGLLVVPNAYNRIPQLVGSNNATAMIGDGTIGDGANQCGLENCSIEWAPTTVRETKCHGSANGISAVEIIKPRVKASFTILHDDADLVYDAAGVDVTGGDKIGQHEWVSRLELGLAISVGIYVGSQVGKIFAALIPNGIIVATPDVQLRDTSVAYGLSIEAGAYTLDSTDTAETSADSPIDSIARVALG